MSVAPAEPPPLRLLPAPGWEPDDDRPVRRLVAVGTGTTQDLLPLDWELSTGVGAAPDQSGPILVRGRPDPADDFGPVPTPRGDLPEPAPWAARLVQGIAEVLTLDRPAAQLARWVCPEVFDDVRRRVDVRRRRQVLGAITPRPTVRSVHVTEPVDGVAEVCALVDDGERSRAYALRLEGADGRWRATALDLV